MEINGKLAGVRPPYRAGTSDGRGTQQDAGGAHALAFVDLSSSTPAFYVTPPGVGRGEVEQHLSGWERFAD